MSIPFTSPAEPPAPHPDTTRPFPVSSKAPIQLGKPTPDDGAEIFRLVRDGGTLELNTGYAYLLIGTHFSDTSVVARKDSKLIGFTWAYPLPERPDTVFVWQIGVETDCREKGLATAMLREILRRPTRERIRYVEATVTPSNEASLRLFHGLAAKLGTTIETSVEFDTDIFPEAGHEAELLVRIGPIDPALDLAD